MENKKYGFNSNWSYQEVKIIRALKGSNMNILKFHLPSKSKSSISYALKNIDKMEDERIIRTKQTISYKQIDKDNANLVLYGLLIANDITIPDFEYITGISQKTLLRAIKGQKIREENYRKIAIALQTPIEVVFYKLYDNNELHKYYKQREKDKRTSDSTLEERKKLVGMLLKEFRRKRQLTQTQFGKMAGVGQKVVSNLENEKFISIEKLKLIEKALKEAKNAKPIRI